jgi:hypothetical protein
MKRRDDGRLFAFAILANRKNTACVFITEAHTHTLCTPHRNRKIDEAVEKKRNGREALNGKKKKNGRSGAASPPSFFVFPLFTKNPPQVIHQWRGEYGKHTEKEKKDASARSHHRKERKKKQTTQTRTAKRR